MLVTATKTEYRAGSLYHDLDESHIAPEANAPIIIASAYSGALAISDNFAGGSFELHPGYTDRWIYTPANRTQIVTVTVTDTGGPQNVQLSITATFPIQAHFGYEFDTPTNSKVVVAKDNTPRFRRIAFRQGTWSYFFLNRTQMDVSVCKAFEIFHDIDKEFFVIDPELMQTVLARLDSSIKVKVNGANNYEMSCLIKVYKLPLAFEIPFDIPTIPTLPPIPTGLHLSLSGDGIIAVWDAIVEADTTAPSVPVMMPATGVTDSEITWHWTASTDDVGVTGYELEIATDAGFTTGLRNIPLGNVLLYVDSGRAASTTYYARVRAHDAVPNNSAYSASVNATTSAPAAWDPSQLPNIAHWYRAKSIVGLANNDPAATWEDLIGSADLVATGTQKPIYKSNSGNPYLEFDGVDDEMTTTIVALNDFTDILIVEWVSDTGDYHRILDDGVVVWFAFTSIGRTLFFSNHGSDQTKLTLAAAPTGFMALYGEALGAPTAAMRIRMDGVEDTGPGIGAASTGTGVHLGAYSGGAGYNANMRIKEWIRVGSGISAGDFTDLADYINTEHGLTL